MKFKYVAIFLVLLCCLMGAASATEDISTDAVDDAIDDSIGVDAVSDDIGDGVTAEPAISDDSATEEIDEDTTTVENGEDSADADSEPTRAMNTQAADWTALRNACQSGSNQVIDLTGTEYIIGDAITFSNSATIRGTANSYITGNSTTIPFVNSNTANSITFYNVNFRNINCQMLIQLQTNGISKLVDCTFTNITTGNDHHSVVYNNKGIMNITGCNFTNCTTGYGVVSNYRYGTTTGVTLNVKDSKFENNHALYEPGAINNCGILDVYNCTFNNNSADLWAGAIHTHSDANTVINLSTFKHNVAGWNGGALYTYSVLEVYNSVFEDNNCTTDTGGGAIGSYNYGSTYEIYIENCTFKNNNNLDPNGHGGAITSLNNGYLNVYDSVFISNNASVGQAICAYNQHYENGTGGQPYLEIEGCNFTNHTGSSDTVYVSGYVNAFNNNRFVNSTQNTHFPGSGNVYGAIGNSIRSNSKEPLGASSDDVIGDNKAHNEIYVNVSSSNDGTIRANKPGAVNGESWDQAYGLDSGLYQAAKYIQDYDPDNSEGLSKIHIAEGTYIIDWAWYPGKYCDIIGYGDVVFQSDDCYNLDFGSTEDYANAPASFIRDTSKVLFVHENIIFDCDVKVGSKNFKFVNCTFKKGLTISHDYQYHNEFTPGESEHFSDTFDITFEGCTFEIPKSEISIIEEKNNVVFDDNCKFPVTAVDSVVEINSTEKGVVVVILTDNSSAPIANAPFKYTVNGGDEQTATTGDDGKYAITGLTGEVTVAVTYEGNESFNGITGSQSFNFTDEPAPSNDTNGSNSTPVTPTKTATKLTASKVTATYNVAKKLVISLKDANGKALANKKVTVKVGSISKTLKTNAKGQVSLNVATLVPKTYTATVKFAGDSSYKASSVNPKVVVNKAKPKLAAKAKTFKAKATIKFAGNKYFKALSKKVKITVKK